jgi:hypothetical protein
MLRIVYETVRDCVIGFVLIVAALAVALLVAGGASHRWFTICLCIGLLPFVWFTKKRAAVRFGWLEYLAWSVFLIAIFGVREHLTQRWGHRAWVLALSVSVGCFFGIYMTIRKRLENRGWPR